MSFTKSPLRNARILEQEARGFYRPQPSNVGLYVEGFIGAALFALICLVVAGIWP